jgi:hypothetical protein
MISCHIEQRPQADGGAKEVGTLGYDGADEQTSVGSSSNSNATGNPALLCDQPLRRCDEIIESILTVFALSRAMPLLAKF